MSMAEFNAYGNTQHLTSISKCQTDINSGCLFRNVSEDFRIHKTSLWVSRQEKGRGGIWKKETKVYFRKWKEKNLAFNRGKKWPDPKQKQACRQRQWQIL